MSEIRVFLSFDVDHDRDLSEQLIEESHKGGSGFIVSARSSGGEVTERWTDSVRRDIRQADQVIVICGEHTRDCVRVDLELGIALEEQKPYFLLWGRRESDCAMPERVKRTGCMYRWNSEILLEQLWSSLRKTRLQEVPEHYKRPGTTGSPPKAAPNAPGSKGN